MRRNNTARLAVLAMLVSVAMVLSYVESQLPMIVPVPGVKIGLANAVTLFALFVLDTRGAVCISFLRVSLSSLLFGNVTVFIYSAVGAALSLAAMVAVKRIGRFSAVGISVVGGVMHNVGQVGCAALIMESAGLFYYLVPLLISGTLAGAFIGILTGILVNKTAKTVKKILRK